MFDYVQKGITFHENIESLSYFCFLFCCRCCPAVRMIRTYLLRIPAMTFRFMHTPYCLHIEDQKSDQEILEYMDNIPSYSRIKRFYTGEDLGYKDSFKMAEDGKFLYIKLFYENVYEHSESKNKQHVLLSERKMPGLSIPFPWSITKTGV